MTRKFPKMYGKNRGGWTDWIYPISKGYLMKCCDCGLVHEMQFSAFVETKQKGKDFEVVTLPWPFRTIFRARRRDKIK